MGRKRLAIGRDSISIDLYPKGFIRRLPKFVGKNSLMAFIKTPAKADIIVVENNDNC